MCVPMQSTVDRFYAVQLEQQPKQNSREKTTITETKIIISFVTVLGGWRKKRCRFAYIFYIMHSAKCKEFKIVYRVIAMSLWWLFSWLLSTAWREKLSRYTSRPIRRSNTAQRVQFVSNRRLKFQCNCQTNVKNYDWFEYCDVLSATSHR